MPNSGGGRSYVLDVRPLTNGNGRLKSDCRTDHVLTIWVRRSSIAVWIGDAAVSGPDWASMVTTLGRPACQRVEVRHRCVFGYRGRLNSAMSANPCARRCRRPGPPPTVPLGFQIALETRTLRL